jgi:uncharacterized protein with von Willebrand factor type A (vWA) domain
VHTFLFGTRLTNVTRQLRHREIDAARRHVLKGFEDWSGGTRIGERWHDFNRHWSRRVFSQGATVLLITDGLERDDVEDLEMRDGPAAQVLPPADLAESASAVRRL